jgi:hypothetical protein
MENDANNKSAKEQIAELMTGIGIEQWEANNEKLAKIVKPIITPDKAFEILGDE